MLISLSYLGLMIKEFQASVSLSVFLSLTHFKGGHQGSKRSPHLPEPHSAQAVELGFELGPQVSQNMDDIIPHREMVDMQAVSTLPTVTHMCSDVCMCVCESFIH